MSDLRENPQENPRENPHWNTRCVVSAGILGSSTVGYITFLCTYVSSKMNASTGVCLDCKVAAVLTAFVTLAVCFAIVTLGRVFFQEPAKPKADHTGPSGGTGGGGGGAQGRGSHEGGGRHCGTPNGSCNDGGSRDSSDNVGGSSDGSDTPDSSSNIGNTPDGSGNNSSNHIARSSSRVGTGGGSTRGSTGGGSHQQPRNWIIPELGFVAMLVFLCSTGMVLACFYTNCWHHRHQLPPSPLASPLAPVPRSSPTTPSTPMITPNVSLLPGLNVTNPSISVMGMDSRSLEYDYYRNSCSHVETIVRKLVRARYSESPALVKLAFLDCLSGGCDASILLHEDDNIHSKEDSPFIIGGLRGLLIIELIKSEIEQICPGVVSCADILVLSAREAILLAGGPFYPLFTGRKDGIRSLPGTSLFDLPTPYSDLPDILAAYSARGFDERETVVLLGAHSIGLVHCKHFQGRLYNFGGTNRPDSSLNTSFLSEMQLRCKGKEGSAAVRPFYGSQSASASVAPPPYGGYKYAAESLEAAPAASLLSSPEGGPAIGMDVEGAGNDFGLVYFRSLLRGRGILHSDQQLMAGEETRTWVQGYAADAALFRSDFARAMMKLSDLQVLTGSLGQVRVKCSKVRE